MVFKKIIGVVFLKRIKPIVITLFKLPAIKAI
jgi:hypothetical protein